MRGNISSTPCSKKAAAPGEVRTVAREVQPSNEEEGNLVSSLCEDGLHRPALDVDLPVRLMSSSTPGHFHLYFDDVALSWDAYLDLLDDACPGRDCLEGMGRALSRTRDVPVGSARMEDRRGGKMTKWQHGKGFRITGYVTRKFTPPSRKCVFITIETPGEKPGKLDKTEMVVLPRPRRASGRARDRPGRPGDRHHRFEAAHEQGARRRPGRREERLDLAAHRADHCGRRRERKGEAEEDRRGTCAADERANQNSTGKRRTNGTHEGIRDLFLENGALMGKLIGC